MKRVVIFGSINMDCVTRVQTHPAPGETILGKSLEYFPGGKGANQAVAAARLEANTHILGKIGSDDFAGFMTKFLEKQGINISGIEVQDGVTGTAFIAVDDQGENSIIVIPGANAQVSKEQAESFDFNKNDILVCQNEIPSDAMHAAFDKATKAGATIIYNPAPAIPVPDILFNLADYVIVNETEFEFYHNKLDKNQHNIIQTLGKNGVQVTTQNNQFTVDGYDVKVIDTTGAGDCFTGAFAAALSRNQELQPAVKFANQAASVSVQRNGAGTGMPYLNDVKT